MNRIRKLNKLIVMLLVCATFTSLVFPNVQVKGAGPSTIFEESFNSGALDVNAKWALDKGPINIENRPAYYHTELYSIKLDKNDSISANINTTNYENINVSFWYMTGTYTSGELNAEYSLDNGVTYTSLFSIDKGQSSYVNFNKTLDVSGANNNPNFKLRFKQYGGTSGAYSDTTPSAVNVWIDDITVIGTKIVSTNPTDPTTIALDTTSATMEVDDTKLITATVSPISNPAKTINWITDDSNVATVENGVVKAVGAGNTRIRASVADSDTVTVYSQDCEITVNTPPTPYPVVGDALQLFIDNFDDPDTYGTIGGIEVPAPWIQENSSKVKTSLTGAITLPNVLKIDSTDSLALKLDTTAYANLKVNYITTAASYTSGSVVVEYSPDDGTTWKTLEEFRGTDPDIKSTKSKALGYDASNNQKLKIRIRVGETMVGNLYLDCFSITGQLIENMIPKESIVIEPTPVPIPTYTAPAGVTFYQDVEIGMAGNNKLNASIAVPTAASTEPMPVVVVIHGGGWNHGSRADQFSKISGMVSRGYIGVALDYRLTPVAPSPAQIQDVKLAIRFLRAHAKEYNIDPDRIAVWGSSAGGHLASLLGTTADILPTDMIDLDNGHTVNAPDMEGNGGYPQYSDRVQAVVDFSGPADFTTDFANKYSSVTALLGKNAFSVPDLARLNMPGTYASPDDPPFFIRHGDADVTIPYTDSVIFNNQLIAEGAPVINYKIIPGQGHGFTGTDATIANDEAWAFLDQYVKNKVVTEKIMFKPGFNTSQPFVQLNSSLTMDVGNKTQLNATVFPITDPAKTVTWYTYDSSVADVNSDGVVTAIGIGNTNVRATYEDTVYGSVYAECTVTVIDKVPPIDVPVSETEKITLTIPSTTMYVGRTQQLTATVTPTAKTVTWYTYNSSVADVNPTTGLLTAKGVGTTKIRASVSDSVYADCDVVVKKKSSNGGLVTPVTPVPTTPTTPTTPTSNNSELLGKINDTTGKEFTFEAQNGQNGAPAQVNLPIEAIEKMQAKGIETIKITSKIATLLISPDAFGKKGISSLKIEVKQAEKEKDLTPAQQQVVGNNPVYDFKVTAKNSDGSESTISKFSKPVEVIVPYKLAAGEDAKKITAFFIDDKGNLENVGGTYNAVTGTVTFKTSHFSKYFVKVNDVSFADLANVTWAEDQIEVMAAKGIINGTGDKKFSPENNITRGDFLMLLVKTLGLTASSDSNFSDLKSTDYYYEAIGIAKKLGLATGTGNNTFEPQKEISRQDMMVLVSRAMKIASKLEVTGTISDLQAFKDKNDVESYATLDVATLVKEGIVKGNEENIEPKQSTTRAEAAVLLYRIYNK